MSIYLVSSGGLRGPWLFSGNGKGVSTDGAIIDVDCFAELVDGFGFWNRKRQHVFVASGPIA